MLIAQKVYDYVKSIPAGRMVTYGQVAEACGIKFPRLVGRILHVNPDPKNIPCHRVVFADGSLAKNYAFGGEAAQRKKLKNEGVKFIKDRVDIISYAQMR